MNMDNPRLLQEKAKELNRLLRQMLHNFRTACPNHPECDLLKKEKEDASD